MANKSIEQLVDAQQVNPNDLFVLQQSGTAKKLTGQILENWLLSFAEGHGGIQSISKIGTSGLVDTYRIILSDQTTHDFEVTNGKSISSVTQYFAVSDSNTTVPTSWSTSRQQLTVINKYLWSYTRYAINDGTNIDTPKAIIGVYGDTGLQTYVWVRWSNVADPSDSDLSQNPDDYIGIYTGTSATAPTTASSYTWYRYKGETGDKGDNATVVSTRILYQASSNSAIIPDGTWTSTIPSVPQGQYLWTQITINFNTGNPVIFYSVARFGVDGTGSVVTVNGVSPDENGNVQLEFGSVSTVNGISPDAGKNIQITANDIQTDDNQSIQTHITELTNRAIPSIRNLLDNPWFTVNQREFSTSSSHGYTIDRWKNNSNSGNHRITLSANHVLTCEAVNGTGYLRQEFENALPPGRYTFSVNALEIIGAVLFGYSDGSGTNHTTPIQTKGIFNASFDCDGIQYVWVQIATGGRIRLDSIKLESGAVSTLANDSAPDYAAELLKCQRYYCRIGKGGTDFVAPIANGFMYTAASARFVIPTPTRMRATPVIELFGTDGFTIHENGKTHTVSINDIAVIYGIAGETVNIHAATTGGTAHTTCSLTANNMNSGIGLSADF